jgi:hypothetical protein
MVCDTPRLHVQHAVVKVPRDRLESPEGGTGIALHSLDLGARRGWVVSTMPQPLYPLENPAPTVQDSGWAPGPAWMCAKNLAPIGIRSRTVQPIGSRYTN